MATVYSPLNCPKGLDADYQRKICRNCSRRIMFVRMSGGPNGRKAHWQHVGDGLAQYRSWHLGTGGNS